MAYAASRFAFSLLEALAGGQGEVECAFVESDETEAEFFSNPILFGVSMKSIEIDSSRLIFGHDFRL